MNRIIEVQKRPNRIHPYSRKYFYWWRFIILCFISLIKPCLGFLFQLPTNLVLWLLLMELTIFPTLWSSSHFLWTDVNHYWLILWRPTKSGTFLRRHHHRQAESSTHTSSSRIRQPVSLLCTHHRRPYFFTLIFYLVSDDFLRPTHSLLDESPVAGPSHARSPSPPRDNDDEWRYVSEEEGLDRPRRRTCAEALTESMETLVS